MLDDGCEADNLQWKPFCTVSVEDIKHLYFLERRWTEDFFLQDDGALNHNQRQKPQDLYLSLARSNDGRKPPALPGVHQQKDNIMAFDELLQLLHIPAGLLQGDAGEVHWMSRHGDAHVEPSGILGKHPDIQMSEAEVQLVSQSPCLPKLQACMYGHLQLEISLCIIMLLSSFATCAVKLHYVYILDLLGCHHRVPKSG